MCLLGFIIPVAFLASYFIIEASKNSDTGYDDENFTEK